jgi:hypothetical protein
LTDQDKSAESSTGAAALRNSLLEKIQVPAPPALPPEAPISDDTDGPKTAHYLPRIVAFVDILGFKDIVYRSRTDENLFNSIYGALDIRNDELALAYAAEVGIGRSANEFDDKFHTFSDCIVMSVSEDIEELGLLLYVVFHTCRRLLKAGFLSRGGIACGDLLHHAPDRTRPDQLDQSPMVFGPAFIDAYNLESAHADGARVILQNKVRQMIDDYCEDPMFPNPRLKLFFDAHVDRAADGPSFVNLFADFPGNAFYKPDLDVTADIELIHSKLCHALNQTSDKPHQFKKNAMLAEEFNRALEMATQVPRHKHLASHIIPARILPSRHSRRATDR